jgi:hypothetical protein
MSSSIVSWTLANEGVDAKRISRRRNRPRVMLGRKTSCPKRPRTRPDANAQPNSGRSINLRTCARRVDLLSTPSTTAILVADVAGACRAGEALAVAVRSASDRASEASTQAWCRTHQDRSVASSVMSALNSLEFRVVTIASRRSICYSVITSGTQDNLACAVQVPELRTRTPARSYTTVWQLPAFWGAESQKPRPAQRGAKRALTKNVLTNR